MGGQKGALHVLRCLLADLELSMRLCGVASIEKEELNPSRLRLVK